MPRPAGSESVLVSMGSNIEPAGNLLEAVRLLFHRVEVSAVSRLFETDPVAARPMPVFLNAALEIETGLEPVEFKQRILRPVEALLGRERKEDRDAPRTIDLDIALFGDRVVREAESSIEIPDPEILTRAHVALPLADVSPGRTHPVAGRSLSGIAQDFQLDPGVRLATDCRRLIDSLARLRHGTDDIGTLSGH